MSAILEIRGVGGRRQVALADYLDAAAEEQATIDAHAWIKGLRLMELDGEPLRRRFTVRGDSLWWFAELYLHKQQVILQICRTLAALERLRECESPSAIRAVSAGRVVRQVLRGFGASRQLETDAGRMDRVQLRIARMEIRARALRLAAQTSRFRPRRRPARGAPRVAAFVHRAFWRSGGREGGAEAYIGPVLDALERRVPRGGLRLVGIGPPANFRARRWWHALRAAPQSIDPIEAFAPLSAMRESAAVWQGRHRARRVMDGSPALRAHSVIHGCDCWPLVREELAGIALLQWPWSARAMDEAAAALEWLEPGVALTYAEAGGWGRALILEARRRGIPCAGLQHGFIYRHWLNYLHEADEMRPDPANPADRGFPRPDRTLVFDAYAAAHLETRGHFAPGELAVTGSPRLDALVAVAGQLTSAELEAARSAAGASSGQALALLVTKHKEARQALPSLVAAVAARPDVQLAIKAHPAETPEVYAEAAGEAGNIRVLGPDAPLAPLLAASRAVVTVNSTVALDAAVLGIPALVIGLPNNLSPFVEAGIMAGACGPAEVGPALERILYDDEFRQQLDRDRRAFLASFGIGADGRAAERAADAVLTLRNGATAGHSGKD